ncbi:glycosyltransferase family 1 protein [bacterium]|nr:glycosyltransferase family 1 protein [bacterium]
MPKFNISRESLFKQYSVEFPFEIIEINLPRKFLNKSLPGIGIMFALRSIKTLLKINDAIIYSRDPWVFFILTALLRKSCIFEAHQFRFQGALQTFIYRRMVRYGSRMDNGRVVCISKKLLAQWEEYGIDNGKMIVAHDAVNISKFNTLLPKVEARKRLGFDQGRPLVIYTGSLIPGKGVDVLVKSANRLPGITFVIVGGDKEQIGNLSELVDHKNVIFVGQVPPAKVPEYQCAADVLALPNVRGSEIDDVTSPMKLFEYIASGRPIVATDMPSLLEILEDGYNALISPAGDDVKLADNIRLLFDEPRIGEQLVENGKRDLDKYSWDTRIRNISALFKDVFHPS